MPVQKCCKASPTSRIVIDIYYVLSFKVMGVSFIFVKFLYKKKIWVIIDSAVVDLGEGLETRALIPSLFW